MSGRAQSPKLKIQCCFFRLLLDSSSTPALVGFIYRTRRVVGTHTNHHSKTEQKRKRDGHGEFGRERAKQNPRDALSTVTAFVPHGTIRIKSTFNRVASFETRTIAAFGRLFASLSAVCAIEASGC